MDEIERFDPATFVGRLLGRGDWKGYEFRFLFLYRFFFPEEKNSP